MPGPIGYPFLTTAPAEARAPFDPVLRSSLAHRHRALNAGLDERDGWLIPASYPGEAGRAAAAVTDVSHVGKLEVFAEGRPEDAAIGASLEVGPGRFVLVCRFSDLLPLVQRLDESSAFVVDRTSAWCSLLLSGTGRGTLLRRVSSIRSVPGRGPLGKVPATILDRPSGYWVLFPQEFAQYGWDLVVDAAAPLGGGPVGVDAVSADEPLLAAATALRA
jgi:hypothetical protein